MNTEEFLSSTRMSTTISTLAPVTKLFFQIGVSLGALLTIIYCGVIGYYPVGLTVGDTLFFVAASLSFLLAYLVFIFAIFCAGVAMSPFLRWTQKTLLYIFRILKKTLRRKEDNHIAINFKNVGVDDAGIVAVGLIVFFFVIAGLTSVPGTALRLLASIFVMSVLYGLWYTKPRKEGSELKAKVAISIIILAMPVIIAQLQGNILNQAMSWIGVRHDNVEIQLPSKYANFLSSNKISCGCTILDSGVIYNNANILLRGIGEYTVVEIDKFTLVVPNEDVLIGNKTSSVSTADGRGIGGGHN